jgi:hypothetical protein
MHKKEPEIEITLNNKKIIQSQTDWYRFQNGYRLTKIDADEKLAYTTWEFRFYSGEWVLAVGNPYNLTQQ